MNIYAVYDSKAEAYLKPFFCQNNAVAIRSFAGAAQQEGTDFHRYAGDYTLFQIGQYDEQSGTLHDDVNINLGCAIQYLHTQDPTETA